MFQPRSMLTRSRPRSAAAHASSSGVRVGERREASAPRDLEQLELAVEAEPGVLEELPIGPVDQDRGREIRDAAKAGRGDLGDQRLEVQAGIERRPRRRTPARVARGRISWRAKLMTRALRLAAAAAWPRSRARRCCASGRRSAPAGNRRRRASPTARPCRCRSPHRHRSGRARQGAVRPSRRRDSRSISASRGSGMRSDVVGDAHRLAAALRSRCRRRSAPRHADWPRHGSPSAGRRRASGRTSRSARCSATSAG